VTRPCEDLLTTQSSLSVKDSSFFPVHNVGRSIDQSSLRLLCLQTQLICWKIKARHGEAVLQTAAVKVHVTIVNCNECHRDEAAKLKLQSAEVTSNALSVKQPSLLSSSDQR
jgi:hypothetical protein